MKKVLILLLLFLQVNNVYACKKELKEELWNVMLKYTSDFVYMETYINCACEYKWYKNKTPEEAENYITYNKDFSWADFAKMKDDCSKKAYQAGFENYQKNYNK